MIYLFSDCALDTERRELRRKGALCRVEPQVFDLLEYLVRNCDHVVSRDDIFNAIWCGRLVSDAALSTRINAARRAIGDSGEDQRLIRTLRGRGLRFVGTVSAREDRRSSRGLFDLITEEAERGALLSDSPTLAVLPLRSLSRDFRVQALADAVSEEIITALSQSDWISVTRRRSSFNRKARSAEASQIRPGAGARYLLEGSLRHVNHRLRIAVRLVDGMIGRDVWAHRIDREAVDTIEAQQEIAEEIATAVVPAFFAVEVCRSGVSSPGGLNTWQLIVRALSLINTREKACVATARALLQKAIRLDPNSARAHSLLSFAVSLDVHMSWARRSTAIPLALQIAQRAITLNPEDAWTHLALGYATLWRHPDDSIPRFEKALTLNPNLSITHYLIGLASTYGGHCEGVFRHAEMAEKLGPLDLWAYGNAGVYDNVRATASYITGDFRRGIDYARKALAASPALVPAHRALVINLALTGMTDEARSALQRLKSLAPNLSQDWLDETTGIWVRAEDRAKYRDAFRSAGLS